MARGVFVVIDGTDGSGKTSTIRFLVEKLGEYGRSVFVTEEATRSTLGLRLRDLIKTSGSLDPWALQLLFIADRVDHRRAIQYALNEDRIILCDRYIYSGIAFGVYDICARLLDSDAGTVRRRLIALHEQLPIPTPDIAFIMSVPARTALERIALRPDEPFIDRFETEQAIGRVHEEFVALMSSGHFPEMKLVDNSGEEAAAQNTVWDALEAALISRGKLERR